MEVAVQALTVQRDNLRTQHADAKSQLGASSTEAEQVLYCRDSYEISQNLQELVD